MKKSNMDGLVKILGDYMKNGDYKDSPENIQHDTYMNIFLDETKNGSDWHLDRFAGDLEARLTEKGLDSTGKLAPQQPEQQERYKKFYYAWYNLECLYERLKRERLIKI